MVGVVEFSCGCTFLHIVFMWVAPFRTLSSCGVGTQDLKQIIRDLALEFKLYGTYGLDEYASDTANCALIVLNHIRRIHHSTEKFRQATQRCTTAEQEKLQELADMVQPVMALQSATVDQVKDEVGQEVKDEVGQEVKDEVGQEAKDEEGQEEELQDEGQDEELEPHRRQLCIRISDVTLDTLGFPRVLGSEEEEVEDDEEGEAPQAKEGEEGQLEKEEHLVKDAQGGEEEEEPQVKEHEEEKEQDEEEKELDEEEHLVKVAQGGEDAMAGVGPFVGGVSQSRSHAVAVRFAMEASPIPARKHIVKSQALQARQVLKRPARAREIEDSAPHKAPPHSM